VFKIGMDWIKVTSKWNKLKWFLEKENRFPSTSEGSEEKTLAEFVIFLEQQKNKSVTDYPNDSNGYICYFMIKGFNKKLDEFQTTFSENAKNENRKSQSNEPKNEEIDDLNKNHPTGNNSIGDVQSKEQIENYKFECDKLLDELNINSLSAFSPELNFIEDENGEYRLTQSQIDNLQRISLIQEFIDKQDYINAEDRKILEVDILVQKNLFENTTNTYLEDNLYKYWDEGGLFGRKWKDPKNTMAETDYFMSFNLRENIDDEYAIPGLMLLGFDVSDNFIPILTLPENKELSSKVFSFVHCFQRDVIFFVNSKKIYVLRYGSRSESPKIEDDCIFDDFIKFLDFSVEGIEYETTYASEKLKQFYIGLKDKLK
jgi:hypothetical protein